MSQHDQFAKGSGEQLHYGLDFAPPLLSFALLLWRKPAALDQNFPALAIDPTGQSLVAHGVTAQMIDRGIVRNLVDPGRELKLRTIARQRVIDLDKDFLGQIEG